MHLLVGMVQSFYIDIEETAMIHNGLLKKKRVYTRKQKRLLFYTLMFALPILQFLLFYIYVNFNSIILAFTNSTAKLSGNGYKMSFTGEHFKMAWKYFFSATSGKMLWNSLQLLICQLFIATPLALLFSYYIAKGRLGSSFFRIMLYLPQVISVVVLGLIFQYLANDVWIEVAKDVFGMKNAKALLLPSSSPTAQFYTTLIFTLWFSFGANVIIYTGAMSGVDQSIVESAQLDGVTASQEFAYIYVPMIFSTVTTFVLTGLAGIFNNQMNLHLFFNNGAPQDVNVFGYYFYRIAAKHVENTAGGNDMLLEDLAALGLIATMFLIPVTLAVRKLLKKYGPSVE